MISQQVYKQRIDTLLSLYARGYNIIATPSCKIGPTTTLHMFAKASDQRAFDRAVIYLNKKIIEKQKQSKLF
jgi:inorganic triphosphatase YgiF